MAFILECCVPFTRAPLAPPPFPDYMEIDCLIVPHPSSSSSSRSCRACVVFFCEGIFALYLAIIFCNNALPCSPSYDFLFFLFSFSSLLWECSYMRLSKHEREKGCYIAVVLFNRHIRAAVAPSSSLCLGTKKGGVMSTVFDISFSSSFRPCIHNIRT